MKAAETPPSWQTTKVWQSQASLFRRRQSGIKVAATWTVRPGATFIASVTRRAGTACLFALFLLCCSPALAAGDFGALLSRKEISVCNGGASQPLGLVIVSFDLNATIKWSFSNVPPGIDISPRTGKVKIPPNANITFTIEATGASPGAHNIGLTLAASSSPAISKELSFTVHVGDSGIITSVNPKSVPLLAGGTAADVAASLTAGECFQDTRVQVDAEAPAGVTVSPQSQTLVAPSFSPVHFKIAAAASADAGTYAVSFKFRTSARQIVQTVDVIVSALPGFSLVANPDSLTLQPEESGSVSISVLGRNGFDKTVNIKAPALPGVTFTPQSFSIGPASSKDVSVRVAAGVPEQTLQAIFEGTSSGMEPQQAVVTLKIVAGPPPPPPGSEPTITLVAPNAVATGTTSAAIQIAGTNFQPGAVVFSQSEFLAIGSTTVNSPTSAAISLAVKSDTPLGPYELNLRNPDGTTTAQGGTILVASSSSLAAPFGVTTAAIVFPREGAIIGYSESVYPKGVVSITGTGTLAGEWQLDGITFDQFTVPGSGGFPVEVQTHVPLPTSYEGQHRLQIVVNEPASLLSPEVMILQSTDAQSQLRILAPQDAAAIGKEFPAFRWTLVPGASGYVVEIEMQNGEQTISAKYRTDQSEWKPTVEQIKQWGVGTHRWRVRAIFPGDVQGESTEWRSFEVTPDALEVSKSSMIDLRRVPAVLRASNWGDFRSDANPQFTGNEIAGSSTQPTIEKRKDWSVSTTGNLNGLSGIESGRADNVNGQLSTQADLSNGVMSEKFTADFSKLLHLQSTNQEAQMNRNWLIVTEKPGGVVQPKLTIGYATPDSLGEGEILTSGFVKGGVEASVRTAIGVASYFESFESNTSGMQSGELQPRQKLRAEWFQLPETIPRISLSIIGMQVNTSTTPNEPTDDAKLFGLLGKASLSTQNNLSFEVAHSDFDPARPASNNQSRKGFTYRLGLDGMHGSLGYQMSLIQIDNHFLNPANPGLTVGGRPGRTIANAMVSRSFGAHSLSFGYNHSLSGKLSGQTEPAASEDGMTLSYNTFVKHGIGISASTAFTKDHEDADSSLQLPETNRSQAAVNLSLTESVHGLYFSENTSYQRTKDRENPHADQSVETLNLTATGSVFKNFNINLLLAGNSVDSDPSFGTTTNWTFSFQGSYLIPRIKVTVQPRLSYSRATNDTLRLNSQNSVYEGVVSWTPWTWAVLQGEVDRTVTPLQTVVDFDQPSAVPSPLHGVYRYTATLTIRWNRGAGALAGK